MNFRVGNTFHLLHLTRPGKRGKIHIRAIVDDNRIVYRYWQHGMWRYRVEKRSILETQIERAKERTRTRYTTDIEQCDLASGLIIHKLGVFDKVTCTYMGCVVSNKETDEG